MLVKTLAGGASPPLPIVVYVFKPLCVAKAASEAGTGGTVDGEDVLVCDGILVGFPNPGGRIGIAVGFGKRGSPCGPPCNYKDMHLDVGSYLTVKHFNAKLIIWNLLILAGLVDVVSTERVDPSVVLHYAL